MGLNIQSITDPSGRLKIATIIIGAADVGLTVHSHYSDDEKELYFLIVIIAALSLSVLINIANVQDMFKSSNGWKMADIVYHGFIAIHIFVGAVFVAINVNKYKDLKRIKIWGYDGEALFYERIFSSALGFLNSLIYGCAFLELYGVHRRD